MTDPAHEDMKATARARAAQAWTTEKTKDIEMDSRLAEAFADILVSEWEDKLLNEAEKRAKQLQAQLDRCEEAVSKGRTSEDCRPGDLDWSEALRKALNLYRNYEQERKRTDALVAGGRLSVDTDELLGRVSIGVQRALYYVIGKTEMPLINVDQAVAELNPAIQEALAGLTIPYEKENRTDFSTKWDEFAAWRETIDEEHLIDEFDLALGWFSGQGFRHEQALQAAETAREAEEGEGG